MAILQANRTGRHTDVPRELVPPRKPIELYVDFESFVGTNCDCDAEWPHLIGKEMAAFLIGIGQQTELGWTHTILVAPSEGREGEAALFEQFVGYLDGMGVIGNPASCAIYHWSGYEKWQTQKALERIRGRVGFELEIVKNRYIDLCTVMQAGPIALTGMWDFSIKSVIRAQGAYDARFRAEYPDDGVMEGASAMVAGWRMYEHPEPGETDEYKDLCRYLETDCRALHQILSRLRDTAR